MSKYKIGDRVEYEGNGFNESDIGTVYSIVNDNSAWVIWESTGNPGWFWFDEASVSLIEPEQHKAVQIIDGIEYPYVTVEGNHPTRIVCDNIKHDHFTTVVATLIDGLETADLVTSDFKAFVGTNAPYLKPYAKQSIFEGLKSGTVVFARELIEEDDWFPVLFKEETSHFVSDIANSILLKTQYEFRLDNPYLED